MSRDDYIRNLYGGSPSSSSSGSSTGTSSGAVGGYTPPSSGGSITSGVGTNVSNIQGSIIDPKANEDAGIYEANQNLFDDIKNSYTSPQDTYASDLNFLNVDPETIEDLGLFDKIGDDYALSDEVLAFYGVDPANPGYIPQELYQMIAEGSIVTPMEAMQSNESNIGTYTDLEMGNHPLLGGLGKYYKIMGGQAFPGAATTGGGGGGSGYGGGGGDGSAAAYAMMNQGPKQLGDGENVPGQTELLDYMIRVNRYNPYTKMAMPQMAGGGIMELVR